jgi:hypothetical protein
MKNTFAIFCNEQTDTLDILYNHILQKYFSDIFLVTDNTSISFKKHYSILYSFYLRFYKGAVIFLNINDYLSNKLNVQDNQIYVVCEVKDLIDVGLDKNSLSGVKLIKIQNDEVIGL